MYFTIGAEKYPILRVSLTKSPKSLQKIYKISERGIKENLANGKICHVHELENLVL